MAPTTILSTRRISETRVRVLDALSAAGAKENSRGQFTFADESGIAIEVMPLSRGWLRLVGRVEISGSANSHLPDDLPDDLPDSLPDNLPDNLLDEACAPRGPFRLGADDAEGIVQVIADLPLEPPGGSSVELLPASFLNASADEVDAMLGAGDEAVETVVADFVLALRSIVSRRNASERDVSEGDASEGDGAERDASGRDGSERDASKHDATERHPLVGSLERSGWPCTFKDGKLRVTISGKTFGRQALLARSADGGARLDLVLTECTGVPRETKLALLELAGRANDRLRFVRIVQRSVESRQFIVAQVEFGSLVVDSPGAASSWLELALEALRAAANLLAVVMPTLAESPVLAGWLLSAARCRGPGCRCDGGRIFQSREGGAS